MKIKLIIISSLLFNAVQLFAQRSELRVGCDFLNNLHFKNGVDTIFVLAKEKWNIKSAPLNNTLKSFYEGISVNPNDIPFSVSFKPLKCSEKFITDCTDQKGFDIGNNSPDVVLKLRCIVFDKYLGDTKTPYFLIDKIEINKE